jgi:hypothetical protein
MRQATHDARAEARNSVPVWLAADEKRTWMIFLAPLEAVATAPGTVCRPDEVGG